MKHYNKLRGVIMLRLKELRERTQYTQKDVADFISITRAAYTNIENGKREPDFETLCKLAEFYNTTTDYILERSDNPSTLDKSDGITNTKKYIDLSELSKESQEDLLKQLEMLKLRDTLRENSEFCHELKLNLD